MAINITIIIKTILIQHFNYNLTQAHANFIVLSVFAQITVGQTQSVSSFQGVCEATYGFSLDDPFLSLGLIDSSASSRYFQLIEGNFLSTNARVSLIYYLLSFSSSIPLAQWIMKATSIFSKFCFRYLLASQTFWLRMSISNTFCGLQTLLAISIAKVRRISQLSLCALRSNASTNCWLSLMMSLWHKNTRVSYFLHQISKSNRSFCSSKGTLICISKIRRVLHFDCLTHSRAMLSRGYLGVRSSQERVQKMLAQISAREMPSASFWLLIFTKIIFQNLDRFNCLIFNKFYLSHLSRSGLALSLLMRKSKICCSFFRQWKITGMWMTHLLMLPSGMMCLAPLKTPAQGLMGLVACSSGKGETSIWALALLMSQMKVIFSLSMWMTSMLSTTLYTGRQSLGSLMTISFSASQATEYSLSLPSFAKQNTMQHLLFIWMTSAANSSDWFLWNSSQFRKLECKPKLLFFLARIRKFSSLSMLMKIQGPLKLLLFLGSSSNKQVCTALQSPVGKQTRTCVRGSQRKELNLPEIDLTSLMFFLSSSIFMRRRAEGSATKRSMLSLPQIQPNMLSFLRSFLRVSCVLWLMKWASRQPSWVMKTSMLLTGLQIS